MVRAGSNIAEVGKVESGREDHEGGPADDFGLVAGTLVLHIQANIGWTEL